MHLSCIIICLIPWFSMDVKSVALYNILKTVQARIMELLSFNYNCCYWNNWHNNQRTKHITIFIYSYIYMKYRYLKIYIILFCCSVTQSCPILVTPWTAACKVSILHHLLELAQILVHWVSDAIQPSHPLSSPSLPASNLSQHQGLFYWVSSWHQVAKVLELQLQ